MQDEHRERLVAGFYDCILDPSLWEETLRTFAGEFGGTGGHFFILDSKAATPPFSVIGGLPPGEHGKYTAYYRDIDPRLRHSMRMQAGEWLLCHEICDDRFVARSEFFQDFFIPAGARYLAGARVLDSGDQHAFIALSRPPGTSRFDMEDRRRLGELSVHLRRVAGMHLKLAQQTARNDVIESLVDALADAIAVVSASGAVSYANLAAEALFAARGSPVTVRNGVLCAREANAAQRLRGLLAQASGKGVGSALCLRSSGAAPQAVNLTFLPLSVRVSAMRRESEPQVLLLFTDPLKPRLPSTQALQLLFGFTAAETRVALAIADGKTLEQYAADNAVAPSTARTQLNSVLAKSGAKRQAELVTRLLSIREGRI